MNATQTGLLAGLVLGLAATTGFTAFLVTLAVGVIGLVAGRVLDGQLDLNDLFGRGRGRDR
ncbi:hypothetical protein [Saccharothrix variisporea]|uniref:Small integral membrane protein DUF2273 n=1 Tax=Saccharothrix variisporea TaxID=543527 RepID=A0A495X899_9PSEU|nr:hypothetical protein [Saccharothrix variisporea]RKT69596.1 hypothetical protein DFJ66_2830 [Saccharothrix variisporea]